LYANKSVASEREAATTNTPKSSDGTRYSNAGCAAPDTVLATAGSACNEEQMG